MDRKQTTGNQDKGGLTDENKNKNRNFGVIPGKYCIDLCNCCTLTKQSRAVCLKNQNILNFVKVKYFPHVPSTTVYDSNTSSMLITHKFTEK